MNTKSFGQFIYKAGVSVSILLIIVGFVIGLKVLNLPIPRPFKVYTDYVGFILLSLVLLGTYIFSDYTHKQLNKWKLPAGICFLLYGLSVFHPIAYRFKSVFLIILLFIFFYKIQRPKTS